MAAPQRPDFRALPPAPGSRLVPPPMATRSKSSQRWLKEHFSDPYVKKAQAEGLRSRAAYKLEELVERDRLLRPGMVVVALGAAPGGWSQWVRQALGGMDQANPGRVLALDILDMPRSEEHTSELQSLMRISYAVFCLKKKKLTARVREEGPRNT